MNTLKAVKRFVLVLAGVGMLTAGGCGEYVTPSRGADLADIGGAPLAQPDAQVATQLDKKPLAQMPTGIAVVRIQNCGNGALDIVNPDVENPDVLDHWQKMPMVVGIAPISQLMAPSQKLSDMDLRQAAAKLHADMLLIYTFDTKCAQHDVAIPLTIMTLGVAPDQALRVNTTVSAMLVDTQTGYVYGVCQASAVKEDFTLAIFADNAMDMARRRAETAAFDKLSDQVDKMWIGVVQEYAPRAKTASIAK